VILGACGNEAIALTTVQQLEFCHRTAAAGAASVAE
jgi:hypothetical protein